MRVMTKQQALQWLQVRRAPTSVLLALGDYSQSDPNTNNPNVYDESEAFRSNATGADTNLALAGSITTIPASIQLSNIQYTLYPFTGPVGSAVLNTNNKRAVLLVQCISGTLYVNFGSTASATNGLQFAAGSGILFDRNAPTNAIYGFFAAAGQAVFIEGAPTS
jgi:hypothetical protein